MALLQAALIIFHRLLLGKEIFHLPLLILFKNKVMITKKFIFYILITIIIAPNIISCKKEPAIYKKALPEIALTGTRLLADNIILVNDTVYLLEEDLIRNANQVLTIEPGTFLKAKYNTGITIYPNGKIIANGTKNNPVVFTSDAVRGTGSNTPNGNNINNTWKGISINGSNGISSGSLSYVRIEFTGSDRSSAGLSLNNVDNSTSVNNIQVSYSYDAPAIAFKGGNCNAVNLVSFAAGGTDISLSGGYTGKLQNLLIYRHPYFPSFNYSNQVLAGIYVTGNNTFPVISNTTIIGPDEQPESALKYSGNKSAGLIISDKAKFHISNSVLSGFPKGGFYIDSKESGISLQTGESDFMYNFVHANDSSRAFYIPTGLVPGIVPPVTAADFKSYMLQPQFYNQFILNTAAYKFTSPYDYDYNPNPMPQAGSPVLTGANFSAPFNDIFFKPVTYRGALGADNWMSGWVNFKPLQTDYNN
jgi:hypothetical protein